MKNRITVFYKKVLYWKLIVLFSKKALPSLEKIVLSFSIRNLESFENIIFPRVLFYLECITDQKAFVKKANIKGIKIKSKQKTLNFVAQVNLRGDRSLIFFDFITLFLLPALQKKFVKINNKVDASGNLSLVIKDLSAFPGLSEERIFFNYPLKIDLILRNSTKGVGKFFLKELGLKI